MSGSGSAPGKARSCPDCWGYQTTPGCGNDDLRGYWTWEVPFIETMGRILRLAKMSYRAGRDVTSQACAVWPNLEPDHTPRAANLRLPTQGNLSWIKPYFAPRTLPRPTIPAGFRFTHWRALT